MFTELLPLLASRSLIFTVGTVQNGAIRVTVTPRSKGKDGAKEIIQPFVVEGTAAELDAELPKAIAEYSTRLQGHEAALAEVKSNMDKALAEAKAEADKKIAEAKAKGKPAAKPATGTTAAKPAAAAKPEAPKVPAAPSLFDAEPAQVAAPAPAPASTDEEDEEDEDVEDTEDDSTEEAESEPQTEAVASTQPSMFSQIDIENEILEEISDGTENRRIAA